jgi:hypothetical protein
MSQDTKLKMQSLISESVAATTSTKKRACGAGLVTKDEDFDGLGLGKWDYANVVTLTKRVGAAL